MELKRGREQRLLKTREAATYLSLSAWTLRNLVWNQRLPVVRIGRAMRFDRNDLDRFIERQKELS